MNLRHLRSLGAPFGDTHSVLVLALDADVERLQPALEEPAGKRIWSLAPHHHLAAHFVDERLVAADHAGKDVVVPVQILGRRMNYDVGAVLDGTEINRAGEGRVDHQRDSFRMREAL